MHKNIATIKVIKPAIAPPIKLFLFKLFLEKIIVNAKHVAPIKAIIFPSMLEYPIFPFIIM